MLEKEKEALKYLSSDKLMKHLIAEVHKEGVIGEEDNILILALKMSLRLVKNASATSSNMLVSDNSGLGKDFLTKAMCDVMLVPEVTYFHRTAISPKVLNYWQPIDNSTGEVTTWDGKVLYLEDPEADLIKSQAFKVMASGGTSITVVKDQAVLEKEIDGKPVIIVTSMKTSIDVEGERRWDCIRLDGSKEVTNKVIERVAFKAAGLIDYQPDEGFRNLLRSLSRYTVVIPFANDIVAGISRQSHIRTQILKLLDYVKASAVLHQSGRQKTPQGELIAEPVDYEYARTAFLLLKDEEATALTRKEQTLRDYLIAKGTHVKIRDIVHDLQGFTKDWVHRHKEDLIEREIIKIVMDFDPDSNRDIEHYAVVTRRKTSPIQNANQIFGDEGYVCSGQFFNDINKDRVKEGLSPIFKDL